MATSTIKTDSNNDLFVDDSHDLVVLTDLEAVTQDVRAATLMRAGEDIYNVNAGVKYLEYVFTPQQNYDEARRSLAQNILASPDVINIEQLTVDIEGETFDFEARVLTLHGPTTVRNNQ
jgi:hypothetical protein